MMSDVRSNSSYAVSSIEFNSKSLNPVANMNTVTLNKIKRDADSFMDCTRKCTLIWTALAKNQMAGSNLTEKVLQGVFGQFQAELYSFTRLASLREFMRIFDVDKDGCLNPDEQIGIFSFIKQRVELAANTCLQVQQYIRFEALMKQVRSLESSIASWQNQLRAKVHGGQLKEYRREGQERVDEFCEKCEKQFQELEHIQILRRDQFQQRALHESKQLEDRLASPAEYVKIKPANRLKELQFQQKLVSLEERVYEALDFRKQLNELQIKEKERVDELMKAHADYETKHLAQKHQRQRQELEIKLRELEDKLIIRLKKEFEVLRKKNGLHEIEIRRLQALEKRWAEKKAIEGPELQRTKMLKRQRNEVLEQFKKAVLNSAPVSEESIVAPRSKNNAKSILQATINFKITARGETQGPVNSRFPQSNTTSLSKYLKPSTREKQYSLCRMYNRQLEPLPAQPLVTQAQKLNESARKYQFVMSKIARGS